MLTRAQWLGLLVAFSAAASSGQLQLPQPGDTVYLREPRIDNLPNPPRGSPQTVKIWRTRLEKAEEAIQAGRFKAARKECDQLLEQMRDSILRGEAAGRWLGIGVLLRSVSRAGLGDRQGALWDWDETLALEPAYAEVDLNRYGAAGAALGQWIESQRTEGRAEASAAADEIKLLGVEGPQGERVTPPIAKVRTQPIYPSAKSGACIDGPAFARLILSKEGLPIRVSRLGEYDPVFVFAVIEAASSWRFEPATLGGRPVKVYYNLKVNFVLPHCQKSPGSN